MNARVRDDEHLCCCKIISVSCRKLMPWTIVITDEKSELLGVSKAEQESLLQELNTTKQNHKETQVSFWCSFMIFCDTSVFLFLF